MLDDIAETFTGQDLRPKVSRAMAIRIHRVALAVIVPAIERQKVGLLPIQLGGHPDLIGVHREVDQTTPKLKQRLLRITGLPILLFRVIYILPRPRVFELHRCDR